MIKWTLFIVANINLKLTTKEGGGRLYILVTFIIIADTLLLR